MGWILSGGTVHSPRKTRREWTLGLDFSMPLATASIVLYSTLIYFQRYIFIFTGLLCVRVPPQYKSFKGPPGNRRDDRWHNQDTDYTWVFRRVSPMSPVTMATLEHCPLIWKLAFYSSCYLSCCLQVIRCTNYAEDHGCPYVLLPLSFSWDCTGYGGC